MPEMHGPRGIARGKSPAAANFGLECSGVGSEGSQGSAVIRVSREEQEAVTHILRLFEQVNGWARARRGVGRDPVIQPMINDCGGGMAAIEQMRNRQ